MTYPIYGYLGPASGATVDSLRRKVESSPLEDIVYQVFSFEILVERTNLAEWEHSGCPRCGNRKDMIVLSIDKKAAFYDCPCGHRWVIMELAQRTPYEPKDVCEATQSM